MTFVLFLEPVKVFLPQGLCICCSLWLETVPPVLAWMPRPSPGAPPVKGMLWPHHLNERLLQGPTSRLWVLLPPLFVVIVLILPELAWLICLLMVPSPRCKIHKGKHIVTFTS